MRIVTQEELAAILALHAKWLDDADGGVRADLSDASLDGASLDGARLDGASLDGASLDRARLVGASLDGASLDGASLDGASLDHASLDGARLDRASLVGARLDGARLDRARLDRARLDGASLVGADLSAIRNDLRYILDKAAPETAGLLSALRAGRIDGSTYEGKCACLVGTLANQRGCKYTAIPGVTPNSSRPAEIWFMAILPGVTPENSPIAKITEGWIEEWGADHGVELPGRAEAGVEVRP